jgi:ABC-type cobalamin/Fe3+-siderophores transport system ATPase subunit
MIRINIGSATAADTFWSYFQDKFNTTHYRCVAGDNGSGKSTVGDAFEVVDIEY